MAVRKATKPTTRAKSLPKVAEVQKVEAETIQKEVDMSKVTKDTPKWGALTVETHNLTFIGEELVEFEIQLDELNPENHKIICINGNQIILGVGETLLVPKSVYDNYTKSVRETNSAKKRMAQSIEIK